MKKRKRITVNDSDDSDAESESADSDYTVNDSKTAPKKKATARKRGRPPKQKSPDNQDDSDDLASTRPNTPGNASVVIQSEDDSSDSDNAVNNSTASKMAKKLGRLSKQTINTQDDSDDLAPTQPNTPQIVNDIESEDNSSDSDHAINNSTTSKKTRRPGRPSKQTTQDDSDDLAPTQPNTPQIVNDNESEDNSSDSDHAVSSTSRPKRTSGEQTMATSNKRQRLQNGTSRDTSPQPSTSYHMQNGTSQNAQDTESDSDSNSVDSDYGPLNEKSIVKKKQKSVAQSTKQKATKQQPQRSSNKKINYFANNNAKYDPSSDAKLVETLAQKLVYFLLIEDQKKYAIRRKAIVTHVFKDEYYTPKLYIAVIKKANSLLKKVYGMELMQLENQKDSYLIVNILRRELGIHEYVELPRIKQQQHGLITFLLTVIFMNENVITEDELTKSLKQIGIDLASKRLHPVFGDVKKYITTELVRQMYLTYEPISKEPPKYEFGWGVRAKQEFDKRDLLQFACSIIDDTAPEDWKIQFRDAESSAKPSADS